MNIYPLKTAPCYVSGKATPWGGNMLADAFMKDALEQTGISYEASAEPEHESLVREGSCAGRTLSAMTDLWGSNLTGQCDCFPICLKLIDTAETPEEAFVNTGSTAWVILNCDVDSRIELNGEKIAVKPGYVFHFPAGCSCRPCAGMTIYEVSSAVPGNDEGKVSDRIYGTTSLCKGGSRTYYVSDRSLELCRLNVFGCMPLKDARMLVLTPFAPCELVCGEERYELDPFNTVIIPAALENCALVSQDCKVMMACISDRETLRNELGYRSENVAGLID